VTYEVPEPTVQRPKFLRTVVETPEARDYVNATQEIRQAVPVYWQVDRNYTHENPINLEPILSTESYQTASRQGPTILVKVSPNSNEGAQISDQLSSNIEVQPAIYSNSPVEYINFRSQW
jgi:hypothetical protein